MIPEFKPESEKVDTDTGYIKLSKNESAKAIKYNWDIKLLLGTKEEDYLQLIASIEKLNNKLLSKFNTQEL
jgi:acetoin utilization deacetylase AcuC-like enzyme